MHRRLERTELKICDFKNHWRFSLRCFSKGVIPVSLKLKNNIRTHKSDCIIYSDEKKLLNERLRNINNTIGHYEHEKYMYENKLTSNTMRSILIQLEKQDIYRCLNDKNLSLIDFGRNIMMASTIVATQNRTTVVKTSMATNTIPRIQNQQQHSKNGLKTYPAPPDIYTGSAVRSWTKFCCAPPRIPPSGVHNCNRTGMPKLKGHWSWRTQGWHLQGSQTFPPS